MTEKLRYPQIISEITKYLYSKTFQDSTPVSQKVLDQRCQMLNDMCYGIISAKSFDIPLANYQDLDHDEAHRVRFMDAANEVYNFFLGGR